MNNKKKYGHQFWLSGESEWFSVSTITLAKPISLDLTCLYLLLLGIVQDGVGVTYQYAEYITGNQILY